MSNPDRSVNTRFAPVAGHPGIFRNTNTGKLVVRSLKRTGRPSTFSTIKEALREQGIRRGGARAASMQPFADYAPRWIDSYGGRSSKGLDPDTRKAYRDAIERLAVPYFKRTPLARIDKPAIKRYIAHLRDKHQLSVASIQKYMAPLRAMFAELVEDGLMPDNPATVRIVGRKSSKPPRPKVVAPAVVQAIVPELPETLRDLFLVLALTGLRVAEVCGLKWCDLGHDADGQPILTIERQYRDGRYKDYPKTESGFRTVPLTAELARTLMKRRAAVPRALLGDPIFATSLGTPYDDHNIRRSLRATCDRLDVQRVTPHMLRHTIGSLLYERGWTDVEVQGLLGHKDANFARRVYLHAIKGGNIEVINDAYGFASDSDA